MSNVTNKQCMGESNRVFPELPSTTPNPIQYVQLTAVCDKIQITVD